MVASASIAPPSSNSSKDLTEVEIQTLLAEITHELFQSPTYRDVMHLLAVTPDRDANTNQRAAQTIARHAIRMTLTQLRQRPSAMPQTSTRRQPPLPLPPRPKPRSVTSTLPPQANNSDILSARQQTYLQDLGRQLRARRQNCRFSLAQLHHLTKIPLQHLQALEAGQLDLLPTNPGYLWGTIRIWGNVLGLDGFQLATGIPDGLTHELPISSAPPSRSQPIVAPQNATPHGTTPDPLSRGLAYGTLVAGTLVGLSWISDTIKPVQPPTDAPAPPPSANELKQQLEIQRAILPSDIAPPEGIRRHLRRD
ncbi:MAG: helix-turn-helix domain-containing protein [Oscillatoriales cyanobacterium]|nr:MAG: helix-turn-helix domain-containing protein [Oscillatoriales cyanobacterium]